jgi:hypothetical protein
MTQEVIAPLFGFKSASVVGDIVHAWAVALNAVLSMWFPTPSRSQLLQAYPERFIRAFGHARTFMLLDATEVTTQIPCMKTAHAITCSDYKSRDTMKCFAGCNPIGCTFDGSLAKDGNPGSLSDSLGTEVMNLLDCVPFGMAVEVDKGFLIDNSCAWRGIGCMRPTKKLKNQSQQSAEDTGWTQKIGNARIVIKQVNGGAKLSTGCFNGVIPILQLGLAPVILRVAFLMQNSHPAFISGVFVKDCFGPKKDRPCRAAIRWCGCSDEDLVDVRGDVKKWGARSEINRFVELRKQHSWEEKSQEEIGQRGSSNETFLLGLGSKR